MKKISERIAQVLEGSQMEESVWFMEILKAFVHRQTLEASPAISAEEILKIAKMHNVTGSVITYSEMFWLKRRRMRYSRL